MQVIWHYDVCKCAGTIFVIRLSKFIGDYHSELSVFKQWCSFIAAGCNQVSVSCLGYASFAKPSSMENVSAHVAILGTGGGDRNRQIQPKIMVFWKKFAAKATPTATPIYY
jgi:hypothetical protein